MPLPEKSHLDAVRKLRGDAHVSFPGGSTSVLKVERAHTVPRGTAWPAFLTADDEYPSAKLVEQQVTGGDANHVEVYRLYHSLPGAVETRHTVDEETRAPVQITTQLIDGSNPSALAAQLASLNVPGTFAEFQPINAVYGTLITTTINGGTAPVDRAEYRYTEYNFPALLYALRVFALVQGSDGTPRIILQPDRRSSFTRTALARIDIKYGPRATLEQYLDPHHAHYVPLFNPKFKDLVHNGIAFDINERNVLTDAITAGDGIEIEFVSGKWPAGVHEYFRATASDPTRSEYVALIGTEQPVSAVIQPWKAGWHRLEIAYLRLQ